MEYIPVPGVWQVELTYLFDNQRCQNVLHYAPSAVPNDAAVASFLAQFQTWWVNIVDSYISIAVTLVELKATDLETQNGRVIFNNTSLPLAGTAAGAALPNNCALVITKRTANRGRSFRGRIYVPGMTETFVTGNQVTGGTVTGLVNAFEDIRQLTANTIDWNMVVVSRYANKNPRVVGIATAVTGFTSDGLIDSQRRRLPGRGK